MIGEIYDLFPLDIRDRSSKVLPGNFFDFGRACFLRMILHPFDLRFYLFEESHPPRFKYLSGYKLIINSYYIKFIDFCLFFDVVLGVLLRLFF